MPGPLGEVHQIVTKGPAAAEDLTRSWYTSLPRASQASFHTSTSKTWHLHGPVARFHQDLHNMFSQGPPQDLGQDLHKSLGPPRVNHETLARSSYKGPRAGQPFCASLRSRHADGHVRRAILCEKLQEKFRARDSDAQFVWSCAIVRMETSQEPPSART